MCEEKVNLFYIEQYISQLFHTDLRISLLISIKKLLAFWLWLSHAINNWGRVDHSLLINMVSQFSRSVMSDYLRPRGLQHARLSCPSPTPEFTHSPVHWVVGAIQSSHPLLSLSPPAFNLSQHLPGSFPVSQFFASGGQSIGASVSASVLPMNIQDWFPLGLTGWISLQSTGLFKSLLQHHSSKTSVLQCSAFFMVQLSHPIHSY